MSQKTASAPGAAKPAAAARDWRAEWPEDFATPHTAAVMAGCIVCLGFMLFVAASFNLLGPVKTMLAGWVGVYNPQMIPPGEFGLAAVVWGLGAVVMAGIVHPSAGVALLLLFRPWIDGYTYPVANLYFVAGVFIVSAFWLVRSALRGGAWRGAAAAAPLAGFVAVAALGLWTTWQADNTARQLLLWLSYLLLFLLSANCAGSPAARRLVVGALLAAVFLEAWYAILHFHYLLPEARKAVQDPEVLRQYFNTDTITPELARRLNRSRAFGTLLFPNSLAGFLLLGVPLMVSGWAEAWRNRRGAAGPGAGRWEALAAALAVWTAVAGLTLFTLHFRGTFVPVSAWYGSLPALAAAAALAGAGPAVLVHRAMLRGGLAHTLGRAALWAHPVLLAVTLAALWMTYTRGAMAALAAAGLAAAVLAFLPKDGPRPAARRAARAAAWAVALCGAAWVLLGPETLAQDGAAAGAPAIVQEGVALGVEDLRDTSSFHIRLTYWKVAARIFAANPLLGVGLGNFHAAYPQYQYLGAGDVREAHNAFLQPFVETGLAGGLLFLAFSVVLAVRAVRGVRRAPDAGARWAALGLFTAVAAFCLHAGLDIHFSNPSLAMPFFVAAGLLWAGAGGGGKSWFSAGARRAAAVALLVVMAGALGVASRIYLQELSLGRMSFVSVGEDKELMRMYQTAGYCLAEIGEVIDAIITEKPREQRPPQVRLVDALTLNPDIRAWAETGDFYAPVPGVQGSYRRLPPDEAPGLDAVLLVRRPFRARSCGLQGMLDQIGWLEAEAARWPRNQRLAYHLLRCYGLVVRTPHLGKDWLPRRPDWTVRYRHWADRVAELAPHSAEMARARAEALFYLAMNDDATPRLETVLEVLAEHARAHRLSPIIPLYGHDYAWALRESAGLLRAAGREAEAAENEARAEQVHRQTRELEEWRWSHGLS